MNFTPAVIGAVLVTTLILTLVLIVAGYKFLFKNQQIFGRDIRTRILSLALTAIFFSHGVMLLFFGPIQFIIQLFSLALDLLNTMNGADSGNVSMKILSSLQDVGNISPALLALATWAIIGNIIDFYLENIDRGDLPESRVFRQKLILGVVFVISIYMSLAAIIAVPYFLEEDKTEVDISRVKAALDSMVNLSDGSDFEFSAAPPDLGSYDEFSKRTLSVRKLKHRQRLEQMIGRLVRDYDANKRSRQELQELLLNTRQSYYRTMKRAYNEALNKYGEQEQSLKTKLKILYINDLARWYSIQSQFALLIAEELKSAIRRGDDNLNLAIRNFKTDFIALSSLMVADTIDSKLNSIQLTQIDSGQYRFTMRDYYDFDVDEMRRVSATARSPLPGPPVPGQELGIFAPIAQWLLTPSYMALVLIVGMLGFGLFGSAISTFVRMYFDSGTTQNIDSTGIIVRGASAAVVIFLAVKGGVSVFIQGDSELNPYSLFLTCLIGSVYSERIWNWAKNLLDQRFQSGDTVRSASTSLSAEGDDALPSQPDTQ